MYIPSFRLWITELWNFSNVQLEFFNYKKTPNLFFQILHSDMEAHYHSSQHQQLLNTIALSQQHSNIQDRRHFETMTKYYKDILDVIQMTNESVNNLSIEPIRLLSEMNQMKTVCEQQKTKVLELKKQSIENDKSIQGLIEKNK